ncbi:efflux RND transporter permease subunit [Aliikangiella sp. IMCC44653]
MHSFITPLFERLLKHPKYIIFTATLSLILLGLGLQNLTISNDFRVYLSKSNPQLQAFEKFEDNYVKSNNATFVVNVQQGDLFTVEGLQLMQQLTQAAWQVMYANRVTSIVNFTVTRGLNDEIESFPLIDNEQELNQTSVHEIKNIAIKQKRLIGNLITPDLKLAVVSITLNLPESDANASLKITEQMRAIRDEFRLVYPKFTIRNGGSTAFNASLAEAVENDIKLLLPISYLLIFVGLLLFLRCSSSTSAIFILISSCLVMTFGFFGWVSPELTPIAGFAPSILLSIMVADSVHILVTYQQQLATKLTRQQAILKSLEINLMPVLITSFTTIVGFLSLNLSASPPYQALGNMVAFGVVIALLMSLFVLPCLILILPKSKPRSMTQSQTMANLAQHIIRGRHYYLIATSLLTILLCTFINNNKLSDNWAKYFDDSFEIVQLVKDIDGYLTGINSLEYSFESNLKEGIFAPEYLHQLEQFETWFRQNPKVVNVSSFSQLMKDLNQVMHNQSPEAFEIPTSSQLAAQYLLFYELGLPLGLGLNNQVTIHKNATRFTVAVTNLGSDQLLALDQQAQLWLSQNAPAIKAQPATGLGVVFAHIAQRNIVGLLQGTLLALIGISIILMLVLKSLKYGLLSLVPNLIPAAMAYGLWGATFGYVDISLSIVACATLGIVVDDTVHFLHKYILARRSGHSTQESVQLAFQRVGAALVTTTTVLAAGFLVLAFSAMNTSATIGILMAVTLIFALIVDFFMLPPLLLLFDRKKPKN